MRRTRSGDILIKFNKGEGQAEKLTRNIGNTFGNDLTTRNVTKSYVVDIRDMDKSTEEEDITNALMSATNSKSAEIKILNVREALDRTKQALVQISESVAVPLLKRIRRKIKAAQCFKCLEYGHMAKNCKGEDRSNLCRKCCKIGYKAKECTEQVRCILCQEKGIKTVHR